MTYNIARMEKVKANDVRGYQMHHERIGESKSNADIKTDLSHLNYELVEKVNPSYKRSVNAQIKKSVTGKVRSDSVVMVEWLATATPDLFESMSADDERRYFELHVDYFKKKYGEDNIMYAVVHKDESTPHMHLGMTPITSDGRLSAKAMFSRAELRKTQTEIHELLVANGFDVERGDASKKNKHTKTNELKAKKLEEKIEKLEMQKGSLVHQNEQHRLSHARDIKRNKSDLQDVKDEITLMKINKRYVESEKKGLEDAVSDLKAEKVQLDGELAKTRQKCSEMVLKQREELDKEREEFEKKLKARLKQGRADGISQGFSEFRDKLHEYLSDGDRAVDDAVFKLIITGSPGLENADIGLIPDTRSIRPDYKGEVKKLVVGMHKESYKLIKDDLEL